MRNYWIDKHNTDQDGKKMVKKFYYSFYYAKEQTKPRNTVNLPYSSHHRLFLYQYHNSGEVLLFRHHA